jgi:UDP-N-acetylmuramate--alanine ligase
MTQKIDYHFIGIGGIGMSALANILLEQGAVVSGSDLKNSAILTGLENKGAKILIGHNSKNIPSNAVVVYGSAILKTNPEFAKAKEQQQPLIHRSKLLQKLMGDKKSILISGTHGKTTTTNLLIHVLKVAGNDPSFVVGGINQNLKTNGALGTGDYFVAEGDESDGSFLNSTPFGGIITNLEEDHLDYYGSFSEIENSFIKFFDSFQKKELCFWCGDDPAIKKIDPKGLSYGFNSGTTIQITNYKQKKWHSTFDLTIKGEKFHDIELSLSGKHNVLNATGVFALAYSLGVKEKIIRNAFFTFKGVTRRGDRVEIETLTLIDDYAHHPTAIKALLKSVRPVIKERRLIVVYQPHRYSRTKDFLNSFVHAFELADELIITETYSAGESSSDGVTSEVIVSLIKKHSTVPVKYLSKDKAFNYLIENTRPYDLLLTVGAGDITQLHTQLVDYFQKHPPIPYHVGIVFGGRSNEHEISVKSAHYIVENLSLTNNNATCFSINKQGKWLHHKHFHTLKEQLNTSLLETCITPDTLKALLKCDIIMPILHGPYGEDGMIQGFLETLNKAYIGPDYQSASLCMDKVKIKRLARDGGIPTLPFVDFSIESWQEDSESCLDAINLELKFPIIIKPVHGGSSIGISKVEKKEELILAINKAFTTDYHIICEKMICAREIEFAVLGNHYIETPPPGEVCVDGELYDYDKKYGELSFSTHTHAPLSLELLEQGRELAERLYRLVGSHGFTRIDFFLEEDKRWWFNEANPIPGLTSISLYPSIWKEQGVSASSLIDRWIVLGLHRTRQQRRFLGHYEKNF